MQSNSIITLLPYNTVKALKILNKLIPTCIGFGARAISFSYTGGSRWIDKVLEGSRVGTASGFTINFLANPIVNCRWFLKQSGSKCTEHILEDPHGIHSLSLFASRVNSIHFSLTLCVDGHLWQLTFPSFWLEHLSKQHISGIFMKSLACVV